MENQGLSQLTACLGLFTAAMEFGCLLFLAELRSSSRIVNGKLKLFDIETKKIVKTSLFHCLLCSGSGLGPHLNVLYQTSA